MKFANMIVWIGRCIAVLVLAVFVWDTVADGDLSGASRKIVMGVAAMTYLCVFAKQCAIAWRYEGAPVTVPLPFRWVVAQWFGMTGLLITWFLIVAVFPDAYKPLYSSLIWGVWVQSTLWFFARWVELGRPEIAGPGQPGSDT